VSAPDTVTELDPRCPVLVFRGEPEAAPVAAEEEAA
jgi:hypothetical protein